MGISLTRFSCVSCTTKDFLNLLERFASVRFAGLKDYASEDYLFLPLYMIFLGFRVEYSRRFLLSPFLGNTVAYDVVGETQSPQTLFFFSSRYRGRNDMETIFDQASECAPNALKVEGRLKKRIDLRCIGNAVRALSWGRALKKIGIQKDLRRVLLSYLARACNFKRYIQDHATQFLHAKVFVTVWDQDYDESIFIQFCKMHRMKTVTLQHGYFFGANEHEDDLEAYPLCYRHLVADYFFAWGDHSRQCALSCDVPSDKILVVGDPKYIRSLRKSKGTNSERKDKLAVFLAGDYIMNHSRNIQLVKLVEKLAKERNLSVILKMHPNYKRGEQEIRELASKMPTVDVFESNASATEIASQVDCVIVFGSSVYSETLYLQLPTFRYVGTGCLDMFSDFQLGVFHDEVSLFECFDEFCGDPYGYCEKQEKIASALCDQGDIAANYRRAFAFFANEKIYNLD